MGIDLGTVFGVSGLLVALLMLDTFQDIYLLRREGVVTDVHWRNWMAAFQPISRLAGIRTVSQNAVSRGIYPEHFQGFIGEMMAGRVPQDPAPQRRH